VNPFDPLYAQCNAGTNADKYASLPDLPRLIDVEVTNSCNFRCLMCPTGNHQMTRASGFMSRDTFAALNRQCYGTGLRFIGWGEPLLHPDIVDFIRDATAWGNPTHLNTNGSKIDRAMAHALVRAGLGSIKFSFQGADRASYAEMRNTDFFDALAGAVARMHLARGDNPLPYIHVSTTTTHEDDRTIERFRERFGRLADRVTVGRTVFAHLDLNAVRLRPDERARLETFMEYEPDGLEHPRPCPEVNDKLTVQWDGSVRVCCNDFDGATDLGNIDATPLKAIWRAKQIEDYRKTLAEDRYEGPLCSVCFDYMGNA
jgi:radical SAM protein with 4Fe4S-binding SPASM domain